MTRSPANPTRWPFAYAVLVAVCTWGLVCMGGLVTSKGVGMAVPDWPTSYGYNMFALPISTWFTGGVFHEHTHRLWASTVGLLVVGLTRWLGGEKARRPLAWIGSIECLLGGGLLLLGPVWRGGGSFLIGIGGVVLLAAVVWVRNAPAANGLPLWSWLAFWAVQLQGLLGGLRVVLDKHVFSGTTMGVAFGVFHGCLGQAFLVLLCAIALRLSGFWQTGFESSRGVSGIIGKLRVATVLVLCQLILGALMRHQHAGLAIHDFPAAYGQLWPATDPDSLMRYNQWRTEESEVTPFQIYLQMFHRIGALAAAMAILSAWIHALRHGGIRGFWGRLTTLWLGLVLLQVSLGIFTILRNKPADIATAHVAVGALTLILGVLMILIARRQVVAPTVAATSLRASVLAPAGTLNRA